jgi:hypothetical protein
MPLANKDGKPFVLSDTLRDLALLRASDLDLATLVPTTVTKNSTQAQEDETVEESLKNSYHYVRSARNIVKTNDRGDVDAQGQRIEHVREELSNVDEGLVNA